jgi:uncharacterized BrkB/YihY/UPF0761 family membrane protein
MKNKTAAIIGFLTGTAGFLLFFKWFVLNRIAPTDEIAPGMVLIAAIITGILTAFIGLYMQKRQKSNKK